MHIKNTIYKILTLAISLAGLVALASTITMDQVMKLAKEAGAFDFTTHPYLEKAETNEAENIMGTAQIMYAIQMKVEPQSRDAHAKGHACVRAEFKIEDQIDSQYQVGLFANRGQKFDAIIRYSNGSGQSKMTTPSLIEGGSVGEKNFITTSKDDGIPDGRGMAVKVLNATKETNILGTGSTQDFMMINSTQFFVGSIRDYLQFQKYVSQPAISIKGFFLERALREALSNAGISQAEILTPTELKPILDQLTAASSSKEAIIAAVKEVFPDQTDIVTTELFKELGALQVGQAPLERRIATNMLQKIGSTLTETYNSLTSYLLASPSNEKIYDMAVKYISEPVDCTTRVKLVKTPYKEGSDVDFLRSDLVDNVSAKPHCFNFYIQPLPDSVQKVKYVEDPRLDYPSDKKILVATITIPQQKVNSPGKIKYCENLSFNTWQALKEHQPLGALNRVRKAAVTSSSIRRHLFNDQERSEPMDIKKFTDL